MNLSKKKKIMLAVGTVLFLAVVCGFVAVMAIGGNREGNAQEQLSLGERYLAEMDYERAVAAFEMAIELEPRNIDAYIGLFEAYEGLGNTDLALEALETAREKIQELVREGEALPDSAAEVYLMLVHMYEEAGNYEEARLLLEEALSVTDSAELQEIWEAYIPEVEFSLAAGEYEEGTELTLTTDGQAVYYTLDGSDPVQEGEGTAEVVIVLQEGNWTIRAAAEGRGGTLGDVTEVEYVVVTVGSMEEMESGEVVEEVEEEIVKVGEDRTIIELVIAEALGAAHATQYSNALDVIRGLPWNTRGILYPTGNRDITGTITVLEPNSEDDVIIEKNFDLKDIEFGESVDIVVPYREQYSIVVSAEGYNDIRWWAWTGGDYYGNNWIGHCVGLIPTDVNLRDVVEIRFLDGTGNLVYPYPHKLEYYYKNTENNFFIKGMGNYGAIYRTEIRYYVRYADGITMGVRPVLEIDTTALDEEVQNVIANVYPIIPDENGIAYITLSDFDVENMYRKE